MNFNKLLVSTKFVPPRVGSRYIQRTQLLHALQDGKHCKLVLVTGSAGFGKTILLAQWRQELMKTGLQVAWLSLSHDERLLRNFSTHLLAALTRLGVTIDDEVLLGGEGAASMDSIVATLVNGLTSIDDDLYLIIDDYHHVDDPLAHALLQKLLEYGPGNLHLVIASRAVPQLSVARLRVMGQVAEVECGDLPFDLAETRAFLEQNVNGVRFSGDEISEIHNVTYGWPASLQLLAITLKNRPESRTAIHDLASQSANLQNYLSEDVLARLPPDLAEFMESISVCRRFNAALAEAITANASTPALLRLVEDENLLIMRAESEDRSPWYRFHPLFAEFLIARLERRGTTAVNALHRRASIWFAERGLVVEAMRHATLGRDVASAVAIIEQTAPTTWQLQQLGPLLHLIDNLSPESIQSHPRLLYLGTLTLAITGRHGRSEAWIAQLRASDPVNTRGTAFRAALSGALSALQGDDTSRALELLEHVSDYDARSDFERHLFVTILASSLGAAGRFAEAYRLLDAHPTTPANDRDDTALMMAGCRSIVLLLEGKVTEAERASNYTQALAVHGPRSIVTSVSAALLASQWYEQDRIDDARGLIENRLHSLGASSPEIMIRAVLCQARLALLNESAESACAVLERQANFFRARGLDRAVAYAGAEQVRILVSKNDEQRAAEIVSRLEHSATAARGAGGFRAEIPAVVALARARLEVARGSSEAALDALACAQRIAEQLGRGWMIAVTHLTAASALRVAGRQAQAMARLSQAVQLGSQLGLRRTFMDEDEGIHALLRQLRDDGALDSTSTAYLDDLLLRIDSAQPRPAGDEVRSGKTALTPREIEMVNLIAAGMSNKRIAQTLGITLETVKWNLKNVFVKLRVSNRYDAMIRARRQGLLK